MRAKLVRRLVVLFTSGIKTLPWFELNAGFRALGGGGVSVEIANRTKRSRDSQSNEEEEEEESRFSIEGVVEILNRRSRRDTKRAHSPHIRLETLIPRRHRSDVPHHGGVQSSNVIQVRNNKLGEPGPLVGKDPLGIRLNRTRVTDELLAEGDHKLVLGDIARVGVETAGEELRIGSSAGVRHSLKELVEEGGRI